MLTLALKPSVGVPRTQHVEQQSAICRAWLACRWTRFGDNSWKRIYSDDELTSTGAFGAFCGVTLAPSINILTELNWMRNPVLTLWFWKLVEFLANFERIFQCSCLNSLGIKNAFQTAFFVSQRGHYVFLRRCRLVSYSSPQRGHREFHSSSAKSDADLIMPSQKASKDFQIPSWQSYCVLRKSYAVILQYSCLDWRRLRILFDLLICSLMDHWHAMLLMVLVIESSITLVLHQWAPS